MYFIFLNRHRKQTLGLWVTESGRGQQSPGSKCWNISK